MALAAGKTVATWTVTMLRVCSALVFAIAQSGSAACFYTDSINEAPVPGIRELCDTDCGIHRVGDQLRFDARKTTDDARDALQVTWEAFLCETEDSCASLLDQPQTFDSLDTVFSFEILQRGRHRVQLRVRDAFGAERSQPDVLVFDIANQAPEGVLQRHGYEDRDEGFVLGRPIDFYPDVEDTDGDELTFSWQLFAPTSSNPGLVGLEPIDQNGRRLAPDVAGDWRVELTVDDGADPLILSSSFRVVVDKPPCIELTDPVRADDNFYVLDTVDGPRRFSVLWVYDALDPFPAAIDDDPVTGETGFRWQVKEPGASTFVDLEGWSEPDVVIDPSQYLPGETLQLRVEVADRIEGPERVLQCSDDSWACELSAGSGCIQRLTWGIEIR